jgi:UDP-N-acetylglucosamine--N-acetylmuramyl-(pentapeptide) pyrophosphoryl-undecaprenol N-acetylglucosamine transferase
MRGPRVQPIVIAAGGTGGHFFPAEALATALLARGERVVLMADARSGGLASPVFANCERHVIAGAGLAGRSFGRSVKGGLLVLRGVAQARGILQQLQPAVVVGFGGYPSVAPILAARTLRYRPVLILHDQNAVLGAANRFLARFADRVALSFSGTRGMPAGRESSVTGNPVRPAITALAGAPYAPPNRGINILVLGGSLGATAFATLIPAAMACLPAEMRARTLLTMQCPPSVIETARAALMACGVDATLSPFYGDVAERLRDTHLVIARAGGSTVAELAVIGRPSVLIPLTINQDQRANANMLVAAGGAVCVEQSAGDRALAETLNHLLGNPAQLALMAKAARAIGVADAATRLADVVQDAMAGAPV